MSLSKVLFSFSGRIPRSTWWYFNLAVWVVSFVLVLILAVLFALVYNSSSSSDPTGIILAVDCLVGLFALLLIYPTLAVSVKRCHDLNHSGWFVLISLIPFVGSIWLLIELGFLAGTVGPNQYGEDPSYKPVPSIGYQQ
jgi:uncharacterized membrane protein YhaH (DUF805 family)